MLVCLQCAVDIAVQVHGDICADCSHLLLRLVLARLSAWRLRGWTHRDLTARHGCGHYTRLVAAETTYMQYCRVLICYVLRAYNGVFVFQ